MRSPTDLNIIAKLGEEIPRETVDGGAVIGAEDGRRELGLDVIDNLLDSVNTLRGNLRHDHE